MKYKFTVVDHDEELVDATEFGSNNAPHNGRWIAQDAGAYAYSNCGGWEWHWPKTFNIYTMANELIGSFEVEISMEPVFFAHEVEPKP